MSKFKDILKAAKEREPEPEVASEPVSSKPTETETQQIKRGRPKGKRSDPDYEQVTAYIRKETYRQTKIALLSSEEGQDFSELVEQLLTEWLSPPIRTLPPQSGISIKKAFSSDYDPEPPQN